ncbi:unnamed protein product [Lactuca saligna]|uniref:Uncharacterized protein n=1 Tax=Lactuca saligna TaxID=75948 RepID=A0AA35VSQ1_LACSI|nr:unnamed protein product [Lactuca saligna]
MNSILQLLGDTFGKIVVSSVELESLLKAHESRMETLIVDIDKRNDEIMVTKSRTFNYEISKLCDVTEERHELFNKHVSETKASLKLKVKTEKDDKVFKNIERFLYEFKETFSKVDLSSQSSITPKSISSVVSNIESSFKTELDPILNLVLLLPINVPHFAYVS